jgi:SAM-dependent methyltransferase
MTNEWQDASHALAYLARADTIPHRTEGEAELLEHLPATSRRVLDVGSGDGRLLDLALLRCPAALGVALDFSPAMLEGLRARFGGSKRVEIVAHDFAAPLPAIGVYDAVISSFAIHHVEHPRKRSLYQEVWDRLDPGGVFLNLEHVASPTPRLHDFFLHAIGYTVETEDRSNKLLDLWTQLRWLEEIGFADVDCAWKWREMALLVATRPVGAVDRARS